MIKVSFFTLGLIIPLGISLLIEFVNLNAESTRILTSFFLFSIIYFIVGYIIGKKTRSNYTANSIIVSSGMYIYAIYFGFQGTWEIGNIIFLPLIPFFFIMLGTFSVKQK